MQGMPGRKAVGVERRRAHRNRGHDLIRPRPAGAALERAVRRRADDAYCDHVQHGGNGFGAAMQKHSEDEGVPEKTVAEPAHGAKEVEQRRVPRGGVHPDAEALVAALRAA